MEDRYEGESSDEEKQVTWEDDSSVSMCPLCMKNFTTTRRKVTSTSNHLITNLIISITVEDVAESFVPNAVGNNLLFPKSTKRNHLVSVTCVSLNSNWP